MYGAGLLFCAWQLTRGQSWARSPVVLAQLLQLGVAWSFRGGDTTWVAICLAVVALVTLAGLAAPAEHRRAERRTLNSETRPGRTRSTPAHSGWHADDRVRHTGFG